MSAKQRIENPYLDALHEEAHQRDDGKWTAMPESPGSGVSIRLQMVHRFAWGIPSEEAIEKLVEEGPILELGAGKGYWASRIEAAGGDVLAIDKNPPEHPFRWHPVEEGSQRDAADHPDRALLLCWPTHNDSWSAEAVRLYTGETVVYVGEGRGGCTGGDDLHTSLDHEFGLADEVLDIPNWQAIHDRMYIFRR